MPDAPAAFRRMPLPDAESWLTLNGCIANGGTAMDGQRKDLQDVDAYDGQSAAKERAPWQRPQWRKLDAGEAELGLNVNPDTGIES
jgi:hypothetical protein